MAIEQFAIPLDDKSHQSGDATFKELVNAGTSAIFELSNVSTTVGTGSELNLKTRKNGSTRDHVFSATVDDGIAQVTLTSSDLSAVYNDANGGDWDYVEAKWTLGQVDTPDKSNMAEIQSGRTYDLNGWPPNH